jgi:hypothetical protein
VRTQRGDVSEMNKPGLRVARHVGDSHASLPNAPHTKEEGASGKPNELKLGAGHIAPRACRVFLTGPVVLHHDACAQKVHVCSQEYLRCHTIRSCFLLLKIAVLMGLLLFVATASRSVFVG